MNRISKLVFSLVCISVLLLPTLGCSVFMAYQQPDAKDLDVLAFGTPRMSVLKELGAPVWSRESRKKEGQRVDLFQFTQGYSKGVKAGRIFFHGAAGILTFGLWEIIGTPIEASFNGTKMGVTITYDKNDRIETVRRLNKQF